MATDITGVLMNEHGRRARTSTGTRPWTTETPTPERPGTDAPRTHACKGPLSPFTCPDCGGTLWEIKEKNRAIEENIDQDIADILIRERHASTPSRRARRRQSHG